MLLLNLRSRHRGDGRHRRRPVEASSRDPHGCLALVVTPGLPRVELAPELVLLRVLPPLVYSVGFAMSWREFRYNIRSISLPAVGLGDLHHGGSCGRRALCSRLGLGGRFRPRRHYLATRRGCPDGDC